MDKRDIERCLEEYEKLQPRYEKLVEATRGLLGELVRQEEIPVQSIQGRAKDPESVRRNLSRLMSAYGALSDFKDLAGVRVITYFSDDVDRVIEVLQREFEVVEIDDKRRAVEPDRFGYASVQCECRWCGKRLALAENKEYRGVPVEIQICTILQHAWAEIEHDRAYKAVAEVPSRVRRRFSRLAGLLELADEEFLSIRKELEAGSGAVQIDKDSVKGLISTNSLVSQLDKRIAAIGSAQVRSIGTDDFELLAATLNYVGLSAVSAVVSALKEEKDKILKLGRLRLEGKRFGSISAGMSLFYLFLIRLAEGGDRETVVKGLDHFLIGHPKDDRPELVDQLVLHFGQG